MYYYVSDHDPLLLKLDSALITALQNNGIRVIEDFKRFDINMISNFQGIGKKRIDELLAFNEHLPFDLFDADLPPNQQKEPLKGVPEGLAAALRGISQSRDETKLNRAINYYKDNRVEHFEVIDDGSLIYEGLVKGSREHAYNVSVEFTAEKKPKGNIAFVGGNFNYGCTCPYQNNSYYHYTDYCKHVIVMLFEAAYWNRLEYLMQSSASTTKKSYSMLQAQLVNVKQQRTLFDSTPRNPGLSTQPSPKRTLNYILDKKNGEWMLVPEDLLNLNLSRSSYGSNPVFDRLMPNLSAKDKIYLNQLESYHRSQSYYYGAGNKDALIHLTEAVDLFKDRDLRFRKDGDVKALSIDQNIWRLAITFTSDQRTRQAPRFILQVVLTNSDDDEAIPLKGCTILAENPTAVLIGNTMYRLSDHEQNTFLLRNKKLHEVIVPAEDVPSMLEEFIPSILDSSVPFSPDPSFIRYESSKPQPVLTLNEEYNSLFAILSFQYNGEKVNFAADTRLFVPNTSINEGEMSEDAPPLFWSIQRDEEEEAKIANSLSGYHLKKLEHPAGTAFKPEGDPLSWVMQELPRLSEDGFQIYGEDLLKRFKKPSKLKKSSVSIHSGESWFELEGNLEFEDLGTVSVFDIKEVLDEEKGIIRVNGKNGQLSDTWMKRLVQLLKLKNDDDDNLTSQRVPKLSATLLDELSDEADEFTADADFSTFLNTLKQFDKIEPVDPPESFKGELRPYQQAGLSWLNFLHQIEMGGILADDMGLGKTIQVLALLAHVEEQMKKGDESSGDAQHPLFLITAPRSVIYNWERETEKFVPHMPVYVHHGMDRVRDQGKLPGTGIILTTYGTLRNDIDLFDGIPLTYFIIDESHTIRNPESKTFRALRKISARHRLCLSGTPVQNTVMDIWSQFELLNPGLLERKKQFRSQWVKAIEKEQDKEKEKLLNRMLEPFILRRTKEQVADDLPPITISDTTCELRGRQSNLYEKYRKTYLGMLEDAFEESPDLQQSRFIVLEGLTRLRQICCSPALLKKKDYDTINSSKIERFTELASEVISEGHRILVFSQFVGFLQLIKKEIEQQDWNYSYLDGKTQNRSAVVDEFEQDNTRNLFLISLKAGGEGINLTSADYVFLMDPWWNPAAEKQAMDRSHRIGQKKQVMVYRFITPGTVEEKITRLQERKKQLADSIIKAEAGVFKELDKKQLLDLFL